jgi:hypothetical protein
MKENEINVCFHIGGVLGNQKSLVTGVTTLQECFRDAIIKNIDEDGNPLPDADWQLLDCGDNVVLQGREAIESSTGILEWDGVYNTDIVKKLTDCSVEEYKLIVKAYNEGEYVDEDVIAHACTQLGYYVALSMDADSTAINVHSNYSDVFIQREREDGDDWCEEYVRQELEPFDFVERSVTDVIDEMYNNGWME